MAWQVDTFQFTCQDLGDLKLLRLFYNGKSQQYRALVRHCLIHQQDRIADPIRACGYFRYGKAVRLDAGAYPGQTQLRRLHMGVSIQVKCLSC